MGKKHVIESPTRPIGVVDISVVSKIAVYDSAGKATILSLRKDTASEGDIIAAYQRHCRIHHTTPKTIVDWEWF